MPRCGATFDENSVPTWTRGDFRGILNAATKPTAALAVAVVRSVADEHGTPTTPAVAVGPASPPRLRRGTLHNGGRDRISTSASALGLSKLERLQGLQG
jgi:hypothetical protein